MGAEAVGQALAMIFVWGGVIWLVVWLVRKVRRRTLASAREKIWRWVIGCGIVSVAAHFLRLHWIEETAGGAAILFIVVGIVLEIDDRINAVEQRVKKLEEEKHGVAEYTVEREAKTIRLTNVDDPKDTFLAEPVSDDCAEAASALNGRNYVFLGITEAGDEIWREKRAAGWQGKIKTYVRM